MEITLLIKSIAGLAVVLGLLIFILILSPDDKKKSLKSKKKPKKTSHQNEAMSTELMPLRAIIKDKTSDKHLLRDALELIIKYHGTIHKKLGVRPHPDFEIYKDILFTICRHPNTNKSLIINFEKELLKKNPEYKSNINDATTKGLNSRGV
jgi:hypothetical protein